MAIEAESRVALLSPHPMTEAEAALRLSGGSADAISRLSLSELLVETGAQSQSATAPVLGHTLRPVSTLDTPASTAFLCCVTFVAH